MELQDVILGRRSIRDFLPKPVPAETLQDIIAKALWAPSWGNTQPWEIVVATGEKLEEFREKNRESLLSGKPMQPDVPMPQVWPAAYLKRYQDLGKGVLESLSIAREDKEARLQHFARMYALFNAQAVILVAVDKALSLNYAMLDVGIFLQTLCLPDYGGFTLGIFIRLCH